MRLPIGITRIIFKTPDPDTNNMPINVEPIIIL